MTAPSTSASAGADRSLSPSASASVSARAPGTLSDSREGDGGHRSGQWRPITIDRWRPAIDGYVGAVKPGREISLGRAAGPFATYIVQMHKRIHPYFTDDFLGQLPKAATTHLLSDLRLVATIEIVLKPDGTIDRLGVIKSSGVTIFDLVALESIDRAAPFGPAPVEIVSEDHLVYLHWDFYRDERACSTIGVRPYLLRAHDSP
jgi:TonB family protein